MSDSLLSVRNLSIQFENFSSTIHAVNGCSFELKRGEVLGLVGESGCGKSLTSTACLGLLPDNAIVHGSICLEGQPLESLSAQEWATIRGDDIAMIFQNPMTALNPYFTIEQQMADIILAHRKINRKQAKVELIRLLDMVHLPEPEQAVKKYPHQFSGGQLQRIMIAIALSCEPKVLIADEPTTALDVTIQAQIILLLRELAEKQNISILFITHDLSVVASLCDRVAVMYAGTIVEQGPIESLFNHPMHPYTQGLLNSVPAIGLTHELYAIPGSVPDMRVKPTGCAFASRCHAATEMCLSAAPQAKQYNAHQILCFHHQPPKQQKQIA